MIDDKNKLKNLSQADGPHLGIHLSGPNAPRTSVVALEGNLRDGPLSISKVYEKIGSFGSLFSDDRIVEIIKHVSPAEEIFIDCPLTLPPCIACTRSTCPGVKGCEDIAVAYMLHLSRQLDEQKGKRRRPLNPQSQRLWDVHRALHQPSRSFESSYSANLSPLVARARVLQRRLNGLKRPLTIYETSVPLALEQLEDVLKLGKGLSLFFRNFEKGLQCREAILSRMIELKWLHGKEKSQVLVQIAASVEAFQGFFAAFVAAAFHSQLTLNVPEEFVVAREGWVHLLDVNILSSISRR